MANCVTGSHDTAGGQGLRNHHRKYMEIADTGTPELRFFVAVLLRITFDHEHYMSPSWNAS